MASVINALRVFNTGNGHFKPVRSSTIVVIAGTMAKQSRCVNCHGLVLIAETCRRAL